MHVLRVFMSFLVQLKRVQLYAACTYVPIKTQGVTKKKYILDTLVFVVLIFEEGVKTTKSSSLTYKNKYKNNKPKQQLEMFCGRNIYTNLDTNTYPPYTLSQTHYMHTFI